MSLAQRIRNNVKHSRETTAEILEVTAKLVEIHEQTIQQLSTPLSLIRKKPWTIPAMKQEIGEFRVAQKHFLELYGIHGRSWLALVEKVNTIEIALIHLGYRQRQAESNRHQIAGRNEESNPLEKANK
jgi:hypothetical protein